MLGQRRIQGTPVGAHRKCKTTGDISDTTVARRETVTN